MRTLALFVFIMFASISGANEELQAAASKLSTFYQNPSKERFAEFQNSTNKFEEEFSSAALTLAVMTARINEKYQWPIFDSFYSGLANEILEGKSDLAKFINDDSLVNSQKLDLWWASYFATGEEQYLSKILKYAGEEPPEGNVEMLLVIGAASWSFKSNCQQHQTVSDFALRASKQSGLSEHKKKFLLESIKK